MINYDKITLDNVPFSELCKQAETWDYQTCLNIMKLLAKKYEGRHEIIDELINFMPQEYTINLMKYAEVLRNLIPEIEEDPIAEEEYRIDDIYNDTRISKAIVNYIFFKANGSVDHALTLANYALSKGYISEEDLETIKNEVQSVDNSDTGINDGSSSEEVENDYLDL